MSPLMTNKSINMMLQLLVEFIVTHDMSQRTLSLRKNSHNVLKKNLKKKKKRTTFYVLFDMPLYFF